MIAVVTHVPVTHGRLLMEKCAGCTDGDHNTCRVAWPVRLVTGPYDDDPDWAVAECSCWLRLRDWHP